MVQKIINWFARKDVSTGIIKTGQLNAETGQVSW